MDKVVELVGGGSVINGASPSSFKMPALIDQQPYPEKVLCEHRPIFIILISDGANISIETDPLRQVILYVI